MCLNVGTRRARHGRILLSVVAWLLGHSATSLARTPLSVWFGPASFSPDTISLFGEPQQWSHARSLIDGFIFSPGQIKGHPELLESLKSVGAFSKLKSWNISTIIPVPAIKEWDCESKQTSRFTLSMLKTLKDNDGGAQYLAMDEPLISALGKNKPVCKLDIDDAATQVAAYVRSITTDRSVIDDGAIPKIIDIEAYPSLSIQQMEAWLVGLQRRGFKPDGFHIDANLDFINRHPEIKARVSADLQELQRFLRQQGIDLGIIVWSGHDPEESDEDYYMRAMSWLHVIHDAIDRPDRLIFQSWVKRCPRHSACTGPNLGCSAAEPAHCGKMSIPHNLPESPGSYSHSRLIIDGLAIFSADR